MSFHAGHGRRLDAGRIGRTQADLPSLPDDLFQEKGVERPGFCESQQCDPRLWFDEPGNPFEIEIGSGKGTFLIDRGDARPDVNILGVEKAHAFYLYAADRVRRRSMPNVRLLCADAVEFLRWRTPSDSTQTLHLYFSDPWPKARAHKHRVVQDAFLADAHRVLSTGGELRIVTDHDAYWSWMLERFDRWCSPDKEGPRFERLAWEPKESGGELVGSNFERKYAREGRAFHAVRLRKL